MVLQCFDSASIWSFLKPQRGYEQPTILWFHSLGQGQSTVAERAETTVSKHKLICTHTQKKKSPPPTVTSTKTKKHRCGMIRRIFTQILRMRRKSQINWVTGSARVCVSVQYDLSKSEFRETDTLDYLFFKNRSSVILEEHFHTVVLTHFACVNCAISFIKSTRAPRFGWPEKRGSWHFVAANIYTAFDRLCSQISYPLTYCTAGNSRLGVDCLAAFCPLKGKQARQLFIACQCFGETQLQRTGVQLKRLAAAAKGSHKGMLDAVAAIGGFLLISKKVGSDTRLRQQTALRHANKEPSGRLDGLQRCWVVLTRELIITQGDVREGHE